MPQVSQSLAARTPTQLTFERFATGFGQFVADPARVIGRWPRVNPLVLYGVQGQDSQLLLDAMAAECSRLEPDVSVLLADGNDLRKATTDAPDTLEAPNLLLLHDLDNLPARALRALRKLVRRRIAAGQLTVLALQLGHGSYVERFFAGDCAWGLWVQLRAPARSARREIWLGILHVRRSGVDQTTPGTTSTVPWQCPDDVRALGARLLHAAYSYGIPLLPENIDALGAFLGRRPSEAMASAPPRCCPSRLHLLPPPGEWPTDDVTIPALETRTAEFRHRCATVELREQRWADRFRIELRADHEGREAPRFEIDVVARPRLMVKVRSEGPWRSWHWGLTAGITPVADDPFRAARDWLYGALTPLRPRGRNFRKRPDPDLSPTMREARARIHGAAIAAVSVLDQNARKVALRFPNHMRHWIYGCVVGDRTGRLAQLAQSCPGALTFAYALRAFGRRCGCGKALARLLRRVIEGRPLNSVLDEAVAAWASGAQKKLANPVTPETWRRAWRCLAENEGEALRALLRAQRLLIRRAGTGVPSMTLWSPPPPDFAPDDIPRRKLGNARWFRAMKSLRPLLADREALGPERRYDMCMFVSRHALALQESEEIGNSAYWRVSTLLDFARATNDWPKRETSVTRYLAAAETWHHQFQEIRHTAQLAAETGQELVGPDGNPLPFPEPPCLGWRAGEDTISPLRTVKELLAEGRRMRNCVASRVGDALTGRAFLFHGIVHGKDLTIQVNVSANGYRLHESARFSNARPTASQIQVMAQFVAHLQVGRACGCERRR